MKTPKFLLPVGLACATVLSLLSAFNMPSWANFKDAPKEIIDEVWQVVNREYVDPTFNNQNWQETRRKYLAKDYKSREDAYKSTREMLKGLGDPYTRFMDPKQYESMKVETSGDYQGVGIQLGLDEKTHELTVVSPIEDTPAFTAGVKPKDVLLSIDGRSTKGMDIDQAVNFIRGQAGTSVALKFRREGKPLTLSLVRTRIELKPVKYSLRTEGDRRVGYIRLSQFNAYAAKDMGNAVAKLTREQADGFILDLRSNPGGLLYASADIARLWLSEGTIVSTVDRDGQRESITVSRPAMTSKPLVVLVDGASASASEILGGALQDHHRAVLVGTRTYGKGLVQSVHSLSDGSGVAVTIAHYQTPSGRDINKKGIDPDIKVELTKEMAKNLKADQVATLADPQYARAVDVLGQQIAGMPVEQVVAAAGKPFPAERQPVAAENQTPVATP
ncbi:S41 family peptidase [Gloeobacter violaceus]|uniref:Carboxyl-terminal-processing protease n=1 Tax=Gloeobacter violaceus (strain ATCC 29082 / PCC 7421) TaxID=251221 RepID=Q7NGR6_GLOVI|nr:S41 family peptidase [Gloeobacter violaceus]BAC91043.1 carboxyl-terminal protease [Gloeobacter violaceus PCC 7421]